ncbi:MAG TPA: adenylate/guanylate cyclase domain-containing protein [Acidimicrobiales bacterium]|nr:adenylate/guanylate cyclase domain-containing protein [Acidimicrobiales bacterium]
MEGNERVRRIERDVARRVLGANLLVNSVSIAAGIVAGLTIHKLPDGRSPVGPMALILGGSIPYFALWAFASRLVTARRLRPAIGWILERRSPSIGETLALARQPSQQTQVMFAAWLVGAPLIGFDVARYVPWPVAFASATLFALAGTVALMVGRLNVEAYLRPVLAEALDGGTLPSDSTSSVLPRLLGSWMFGSAAYLLGVIVTLVASKAAHIDMTYTAAAIAAIGLAVGATTTIRSAIGVSNRVAVLRAAQREVEAGALDTRVDVDDAGELGRLQAGFNRMVEGLAQRRLVEDLFGRHVGVDVARRAVLGGVGNLAGEERTVSVLFVDIVGSTSMTQHVSPSRVIELLNVFFTEVIDCAAVHGGWVNKFEGDGALCIFGAPEELADHAGSALRAAADLRARLDKLTEAEPVLRAAIGVSTGPAVAGNVGNESRYEYTVIGDAVNEAARLSEVAKTKPGLLLVSTRTMEACDGYSDCWVAERRIRLRGHEDTTTAFTWLGP